MKERTIAVHAGLLHQTPSVSPDIVLSTTFRYRSEEISSNRYIYTRANNPNRQALETALAKLEGGSIAFAFASGMAAISAMIQTLEPSAHIILSDDVYHGTRDLIYDIFSNWGITFSSVDTTDVSQVQSALRDNTRLIWIETPSNPSLKIADIQAIADIAHQASALCVVDNTWATPIFQHPLALGADIVMHSTTKYIGGHSDVLGGVLILPEHLKDSVGEKLHTIQHLMGAVPSPFDCWLLLRSLATMPLRVRQQAQNAEQIAIFLSTHPQIERVHYPSLDTHPQHHIAQKQMQDGFGGMLSFQVREGKNVAAQIANNVRLITQATSLGGVETLIEHRAMVEGPRSPTPDNLLRLSVGIEDVEDIIADLEQAIERAK